MSQQPKRQKSKPSHIPALSPNDLVIAIQRFQATSASPWGKRLIEQSLRAAANPDAENTATLIASLPEERQKQVKSTARAVGKVTKGVTSRAKEQLSEISESAWQRLVDEANSGA